LVGFHICMQMNVGDSFAKLKIPRINYLYLFRSKWEVGTSNLVCIWPCINKRIEGVRWNKHRCQNECDPGAHKNIISSDSSKMVCTYVKFWMKFMFSCWCEKWGLALVNSQMTFTNDIAECWKTLQNKMIASSWWAIVIGHTLISIDWSKNIIVPFQVWQKINYYF
jgi:hypothetical protein